MLNHTLKQTFRLLRENPYLSFIMIIGSAIAITLIITQIIADRSVQMDISPETNRHRTLYIKWVGVESKETQKNVGVGFLSLKTIRECFESLQTPEAIVVTSPIQTRLASIPSGNQKRSHVLFTDDVFWRVFDFHFLAGTPYSKADFESGIPKVVVSEQLARALFGTIEEVVGKQIELSYHTYTVCGIVKNISTLTTATYADAWVPYSSTYIAETNRFENITGHYKCQILAHSRSDFKRIRKEVNEKVEQYNATLSDYQINLYRQPDNKFTEDKRFGPGYPNMHIKYIERTIIFLVILFVPAINLSGFTLSKMRERMSEIGIRKAFGGTRRSLFWQIIYENMIYSLLGGVVALFLSYMVLYHMKSLVFPSTDYYGFDVSPDMPISVFFNPVTFLIAFAFCTLLNLLSAGIPAWKISSMPVVESIKGE